MNESKPTIDMSDQGESKVAAELLPMVYDELRKLAAHKMASERPGQTLQPTALVHEAYLRLVGARESQMWDSRGHFICAAAEAMRRILVESARRKKRLKHGGQMERVALADIILPLPLPDDQLLALDEGLVRLADVDSRAAQMVNLCFFVGLTQEQAARELGVAIATAQRIWAFARAWLAQELQDPAANRASGT
jgi:RNA polymerase sigma factor (TIGR02999 family)